MTVTTDKARKQTIRALMAATGEPYSVASRAISQQATDATTATVSSSAPPPRSPRKGALDLLTVPLTPEQEQLLQLLLNTYRAEGTWPTWLYVRSALRLGSSTGEQVFRALPRLGKKVGIYGSAYSLVWTQPSVEGVRGLPDQTHIGLTMAGLWRTGEHAIVNDYLTFLRAITRQHQTFTPGVTQTEPPTYTGKATDEEARLRQVLKIEDLPDWQCREPALWLGVFNPARDADGWTFSIPARFDLYHGVLTMTDYLAAVTEHLTQDEAETRSLFPALPQGEIQAPYTASVIERGWGMTEDQMRQLRLLLWLADEGDGLFSVEKVYSGDDEAHQARRDVETLADRGLIEKYIAGGGLLAAIHAGITSQGRAYVDQIRSRQQDRPGRQRACREALVAWLYEMDAVGPMRSITWRDFFTDVRGQYFGNQFAEPEVDRAAGWLRRHGLVDGIMAAEFEGPVRAYLTDQGTRCVEEFGGDIHRYTEAMEQPQSSTARTTIHLSATNVQLATGDHARQAMTITQASRQVQETIQGIAKMLMDLGLTSGREAELTEVEQEALRDVTSGAGSTTGIRRFIDWVLGCVQAGATPAVTAAMTTMTGALLQDAEQVIHAIGQ